MKSEILFLQLRDHPLFERCNKDNIYHVIHDVVIRRKKKNETIELRPSGVKHIYFIIKGYLKVQQIEENGEEATRDVIKKGGVFGDMDNSPTENYEYGRVTSDELVYFHFTIPQFENLCLEIPLLSVNMAKLISRKLSRSEYYRKSLASEDVRTRLLNFFRHWAAEEGHDSGSEIKLDNYLTHNEIANLINTCRQTVTCILNRLRSDGRIRYNRHNIIIPDLSHLAIN